MNEVTYTCQDCGTQFQIQQGSRQRYCPTCLVAKITIKNYKQGKCERCDKEGSVVSHHLSYDMFGKHKVPKGKTIIVCLSCHKKIHGSRPKH